MSEEEKVCIKCGRKIPGYSRFCPYCGAAQPALKKDAVNDNSRVSRRATNDSGNNNGMTPLKKLMIIALGLVFVLVVGKVTTFKDGPGHHKIEEEMHLNMFDGETAYGKHPKITVDKKKGTTIKISYKSTALKNIKTNPDWKRLVKKTVKKSNEFDGVYGNKMYSKIKIRTDKSKKPLFKVDQGKVLYNKADA